MNKSNKIESKNIQDIMGLTPLQEGMLFHYLQDPHSGLYFEQLSLEISGEIHGRHFEKAWDVVINTNEMLRTVFRWEKVEKPSQIVLKEHKCNVIFYDLSEKDSGQKNALLEEIKNKDRSETFDLHRVPFRVILCKLEAKKHAVIISNHHILYDGWSNGIILREFFRAYREASRGVIFSPADKPAFKEFVKWMRGQEIVKQEQYWNEYLNGIGPGPYRAVSGKRKKRKVLKQTANYKFKFPGELKWKLDVFIKGHHITTASFLYSVWGVLLQNYHGGHDIIFDATVSGRSGAAIKGIENMVGLFINTLPLRIQTHGGETVSCFLTRVHNMLMQWREFGNSSPLPVREILDKYTKESLFDSVAVIENYPLDHLTDKETAPLSLHSLSIVERTLYDLTVIITTLDGIELNITYDNDLFDQTSISRLSNHLAYIAEDMVTHPGKAVSEIEVWGEEERKRFLAQIRTARETEPAVEINFTAPRDKVEEKLVAVWREILNLDRDAIGIDNNFFDFGGHSLKASQLVSRIHRVFEIKIPLEAIFNRPTIRGLAGYIRETVKQEYVPITAAAEKEYYNVSPGQGRLYMLQQLNPVNTAYNGPWSLLLKGPIDKERMEKSFKRLIRRHEILRTSFDQQDGEPVQKIHEHAAFAIEILQTKAFADVSLLQGNAPDPWPPEAIIQSFIRPFDLSMTPLFRVGLIKVWDQEHILVVDMHHIITDGTSSAVLAEELTRLYRGEDLVPLMIQYKDFSQWQNRRLAEGKLKKQEEYWLKHLSGELPVLNMPIDFPRPRVQSFDGERISFEMEEVLASQVHRLMKETGTTLYMALMSVLNIVLGWYGDSEDIVVGTPIAGRNHVDIENTVGFFLETLVIRNRPAASKTFTRFLQEVKSTTLNAYENQDYPLSLLIKHLSSMNDLSRNPLFDVMLNVLNQPGPEFELSGVKVIPYKLDIKVSKVDMTLEIVEQYGKISFELEYCVALFKKQTMERFVRHFFNVLRETMVNPGMRLGDLEIISENEKRQILEEFNNTTVDYIEERTVVEYFETRAALVPDRIAVAGPSVSVSASAPAAYRQITNRELNDESNRLAQRLREKGATADIIVGVMVEPSVEMIISILGILKSGGAYLPVTPDYPGERINYMLKDSGAKILVVDDTSSASWLSFAPKALLNLSEEHHLNFPASQLSSFPASLPTSLAYVIYTSGSTGRPKGVVVSHKNLMGYIRSFQEEIKIEETDVVLQQASVSFDVFVEEVYPCLLACGRLAVPPRHVIRDTALLVDFIAGQNITIIDCSPLLLNELNGWTQTGKSNPLKTIHTVISGGDVLKGEYAANFLDTGAVYNTYGPTETTVCTSYHRLTGMEGSSIPIGKPITNYRVYILDGDQRLLPVGVPGEICISGVGVTAGYLNRPELTFENFIMPSPTRNPFKKGFLDFPKLLFNHHSLLTLYKTGDLGKWLPDGSIEFMGRKDRQVKIRGYRIELGEIETRLLAHEEIKEVSLISVGEQRLCAYFTARKEKNVKEMREFLSQNIPAYMIPAYFVQLEQMPIGVGGKINIKALPKPAEYGMDTGEEYVPPASDDEKKLVTIWQELLQLERIGIMDDFFHLGGDSILVNRCLAGIRNSLDVDIPLLKFFERPYIKALAEEIEKQERQVFSIKSAKRVGEIPLSFAQERLWFLQELDSENVAYFVPRVIRMKGKLDVYLLERTFTEIIRRHEILRTVFPNVGGRPVQRIQPPYRFKIPVLDWTRLEKEEQELQVSHFLSEENQRPFDFEKGPLLRVALLKLTEKEHLFVLTEHHLIHDGWTQGVLLNEIIAIFSAYWEGRDHDLPDLPIQYADYAIWQRSYLQGERLKQHLDYWREKLSGLSPVLDLPFDRPRPSVISGNGEVKQFFLSKELSDDLMKFRDQRRVTLFMTMLGVFKVLLYRYTGAGDLCVGTGVANRRYKEMEGMLGMVINTLALRTEVDGDFAFEECLQRVKTTCLEAYENEDAPFEKIVEVLQPERSLSYTPIFQIVYSFMDTPTKMLRLPGVELHVEELHNRSAKFDINIIVEPPSEERMEETSGRIEIIWEYNVDIFAAETMDRMIGHYIRLLEEAVHYPDVSISNLPMLGPEEISRLLVEWNDTATDYPLEKTIHRLFEEQVEQQPNQVALVEPISQITNNKFQTDRDHFGQINACDGNISITYRELYERSDRLMLVLKERSVKPGDIVAIMVNRSIAMIVGILGILKSGAAYLPLNPEQPEARTHFMMQDCRARVLVLKEEGQYRSAGENKNLEIISLDALAFSTFPTSLSRYTPCPIPYTSPGNPAYVIYTSGSTGNPKGVPVTHTNFSPLIHWGYRHLGINEKDRVIQNLSYYFDWSVWEIFITLTSGASLYLVPGDIVPDADRYVDFINHYRITVLHITPTHFQSLSHCGQKLSTLSHLCLGAEKLTYDLVKRSYAMVDQGCRIFNMYGPTEATIISAVMEIHRSNDGSDTTLSNVPVGRPVGNTKLLVLDKYRQLCPVNIIGELYIGGDGLAGGYLNNPELTAEKFDADKKLSRGKDWQTRRLFKTGDLVKWLPDGNIEFLGRMDHQVKIRGFRIEPGEIESRLLKHPGIKDAVVLVPEEESGDKYLCAYVVSNRELAISELHEKLSKELPDYMIPSYFVQIEKIPLTPNGKIDRRALPRPGLLAGEKYTTPRNEIEKRLVEIWQDLLNPSPDSDVPLGIDDNFFQLGGHSLKATILEYRIEKAFNVKIPLPEIFKNPRIRELAGYIKEAVSKKYEQVELAEKKEYYALSSAQQRLYFLQQMDKDGTAYNISAVWLLEGTIAEPVLEQSLRGLISRHESLRTSIELIEDEPVQRIHEPVEFELEYYDMKEVEVKIKVEKEQGTRGLAPLLKEPSAALSNPQPAAALISSFIRPFDLSQAPLLRVGLVKLLHTPTALRGHTSQEGKKEKYLFLVDMHHIIADGMSTEVLVQDFSALYLGKELPGIKVHYKDYAEGQNREKVGKKIIEQGEYWKKEYEGEIPVLELPTDYARPAVQDFAGNSTNFEINSETSGALKALALETGVTLYIVMLALYHIFLAKISSQEDIVIGSPVAGRKHADLENIIGMFVNTLPLRNFPSGEKGFREFLGEVKENALMGFENQEYQYDDLVEQISVNRDAGRNPLFDTMFVLQNTGSQKIEIPGLKLIPYKYKNKTSKFDLALTAAEADGKLHLTFEYSTKLFKRETIERFIAYFVNIIQEVIENSRKRISDFEIITEEEKKRILFDFNDTEVEYPKDKAIYELFEEQVAKSPDRIALIAHGTREKHENGFISISYYQLNEQSGRLAGSLIEKGVLADSIVGIMMERSIEMIVGILGILKSGGAYLPIDPDYPKERINYMLKESSAQVLVVDDTSSVSWLSFAPKALLNLSAGHHLIFPSSHLPIFPSSLFSSLAYIIYTSGSTGNPKGVTVAQRSVVNLLWALQQAYPFTPGDTYLLKTSYTFDVSVTELFGWYMGGGRLAILEINGEKDPTALIGAIERQQVTHINFVPPMFQMFVNELNHPKISKISTLKYIFLAGEALFPELVNQFRQLNTNIALENIYGPTEAAVYSSRYSLSDWDGKGSITIGKPLQNTRLYILDRGNRLQPIGIAGELCISGIGLACGYLNRPELTSEKFIDQVRGAGGRYRWENNEKLLWGVQGGGFLEKSPPGRRRQKTYKTGDLARWLPDGTIEYHGRLDHQVKIRGFRIELGEIQNRLLKYDGIKDAVVLAEETTEEKYLCAYIVYLKEFKLTELRTHLAGKLPDYMIPSYFVRLEKIPVTPNGKVDRKALPKPGLKVGEGYIAPGNEIEKKLLGLWSEILGRDPMHSSQLYTSIGINDNFFHVGGHSLKATILTVKVHKVFDVKIPLAKIFKTPRIRELAVYIRDAVRWKYEQVELVEKKEYYVLSSAQKRLYFLQQMDKDSTAYNIPSIMILEGILYKDRLEQSILEIIRRHESLRTSIEVIEVGPVQRINEHVEFQVDTGEEEEKKIRKVVPFGPINAFGENLATEDTENTEGKPAIHLSSVICRLSSEFIRPFNLSDPPLLRVGLVKLLHTPTVLCDHPSQEGEKEKYLFLVDMHHIISDGMSTQVLVQDFSALYAGKELPEIKSHYKDYAEWQNREKISKKILEQGEYWKKEYEGEIPVLELQTDYTRPAVQGFEGNSINFEINSETSSALKALALETGATLYIVLLALYTILLAKLSSREDIVIGSPVAGRRHADLEKIIGMFVNTLALRNYPSGEKKFNGFLEEVKEKTLKAFENQEYQYEDLVEKVAVTRDVSRNPLFDTMFVLQNTEFQEIEISGLKLVPYEYENKTAKFDLTLTVVEVEEKLQLTFGYSTRLFKRETVERFIIYFTNIARKIVENKNRRISDLEILTEEEKRRILIDFNDTKKDYPRDKTIQRLFEEQVENAPGRIAVVGAASCGGPTVMTYNELNDRSNRLARLLIEKGILEDNIAGIIMERSVEMIIGIMGILKSGGAYLPIDPEYPQERIDYMLKDSSANVLVTFSTLAQEVKRTPETIFIDAMDATNPSSSQLLNFSTSSSLAYIIYTSGSTGKPKGVMVEHRSVINILAALQKEYPLEESDTYLLKTSYLFDVSLTELFGWYLEGGRLAVLARGGEKDPQSIIAAIWKWEVTHINFVPSMFNAFVEILNSQRTAKLSSLKYIFLAGEALNPGLVEKFRQLDLKILLENIYGPTEGTIYASKYSLSSWNGTGSIPIGKPLQNIKLDILDKYGYMQPIGIAGELCIGGAGLARGYLNRPGLTYDKFKIINDKLKIKNGSGTLRANLKACGEATTHHSPIYKTGDLARWQPDGNIEFLGRIDNQIKVRGFRVELGEIEYVLSAHPGIKESVVVAKEGNDCKYLCAYVTPQNTNAAEPQESSVLIQELQNYLSQRLPHYMVPSHFIVQEKMPLTPTGKVDRQVLSNLKEFSISSRAAYTAPGNEMEKIVAAVWKEILHLEEVGIHDNFFALGGNSITILKVNSRLEMKLKKSFPVVKMFKYPTIHGLAHYLLQGDDEVLTVEKEKKISGKMARGKDRLRERSRRRNKEEVVENEQIKQNRE